MKIMMIPETRNEELIAKIREAKMNGECIEDAFEPSSELFDALYYACECGDMMLENQAKYFQDCLFNDEKEYYIERMLADLRYKECLQTLAASVENGESGAWKLHGMLSSSGQECHVTFAMTMHTEGWEYFYTDSTFGYSEDGVYDDPDSSPFEAINNLFERFGFYPIEIRKTLDWDNVVEEYESRIR